MASRCRQQPAKSPAKGEPPKPTAAAAITNTQMTPEESADAMKTRYASMEIGEPKPVAIKVETEIIEHEVEWRNPPTQDQIVARLRADTINRLKAIREEIADLPASLRSPPVGIALEGSTEAIGNLIAALSLHDVDSGAEITSEIRN